VTPDLFFLLITEMRLLFKRCFHACRQMGVVLLILNLWPETGGADAPFAETTDCLLRSQFTNLFIKRTFLPLLLLSGLRKGASNRRRFED
jgi:hypothetical protein